MPVCPVHQKQMKEGKFGFFCTEFVGVGEEGTNGKGYCNQEVKAARPAAAPAKAPATPSASPISPRLQAAQAAIQAACTLNSGAGKPMYEVLNHAATIYHDFLKPAVTGDVPLAFARPEDADIPF